MKAAPGRGDALAEAIERAAGGIRQADGCEGVTLLRGKEADDDMLFIERWATVEHHQGALNAMPPGTLDEIQANLAGPPEGSYMDWLA